MAITAKKSFTLKKKDLATSKIPAVGFRKTVAYHKATAGDASINLTALSLPTEMSSAGYSNPTVQTLLAADLTFYRDNLALISSARGYLQPGLSYNVTSNTNIIFSDSFGTALADEIFTIIIDPIAKTGTEFVDGVALPVTGSLAAGVQDFNIGVPFEANKFPTTQMGAYQVFYDGVLQSRNVGNATASPSADGNYQEVAGTGGLASLIRFNVIDNDNAHDIKCIPVGLMIERPSGSTRAELERQQGQINKIVEVLSDVAGTPESTFTAAPSEVDLKTFGDRVLTLESNRARIDQDNNWSAEQSFDTGLSRPGDDAICAAYTTSVSNSGGTVNPLASFASVLLDVTSAFSGGSTYTCKRAGNYKIKVTGHLAKSAGTSVAGDVYNLDIKKNGSNVLPYPVQVDVGTTSLTLPFSVEATIPLLVGDAITISLTANLGGGRTATFSYAAQLNISRV